MLGLETRRNVLKVCRLFIFALSKQTGFIAASGEAPAAKRAKVTAATATPVPTTTSCPTTRASASRGQTIHEHAGVARTVTMVGAATPLVPALPTPSKTTLGRRLVKSMLGLKGPIGVAESVNGVSKLLCILS